MRGKSFGDISPGIPNSPLGYDSATLDDPPIHDRKNLLTIITRKTQNQSVFKNKTSHHKSKRIRTKFSTSSVNFDLRLIPNRFENHPDFAISKYAGALTGDEYQIC